MGKGRHALEGAGVLMCVRGCVPKKAEEEAAPSSRRRALVSRRRAIGVGGVACNDVCCGV